MRTTQAPGLLSQVVPDLLGKEQSMIDSDTLQRAIDKAMACGWQGSPVDEAYYYEIIFSHSFAKSFFGVQEVLSGTGRTFDEYSENARQLQQMSPKTIRADWDYWRTNGMVITAWQYHLQKMVLEEEPLNYLERFLEEEPAYEASLQE
jgi:hypothetical protein